MVMESTNALSDDLSMLATKMKTLAASIGGIRAHRGPMQSESESGRSGHCRTPWEHSGQCWGSEWHHWVAEVSLVDSRKLAALNATLMKGNGQEMGEIWREHCPRLAYWPIYTQNILYTVSKSLNQCSGEISGALRLRSPIRLPYQ